MPFIASHTTKVWKASFQLDGKIISWRYFFQKYAVVPDIA